MTLEQLRDAALATHQQIRSMRVQYTSKETPIRDIPEIPTVPRFLRLTAVFSGEKRLFLTEPLDKKKNQLQQLLVFDADTTATCDMRDGIITNVFLDSGKHPYIDRDDQFLAEALDIPLADSSRSSLPTSWFFPYCITARTKSKVPNASQYQVLPTLEKIDGAWCHVVELAGFDKIWVDAGVGCLWRRRERNYDDRSKYLLTRKHNSDFRGMGGGIWIPWRYFREAFSPPSNSSLKNVLFQQLTMDVQEAAVNNIEDAAFRVKVQAGTAVANMDTGVNVRIPRTIDESVKELAAISRSRLGGWWPSRWMIVVGLTLMSALVGAWYAHRRRRA